MARTRPVLYGDALAHVQDAGFGDFARGAAPGLLALLARAGIRRGTVVDLGCGAGVWLRALGDAGYDAVGVDVSPALARIARRAAPRARVACASVYDFPLPPCDAVTALGEVLGYLPADGARIPPFGAFFRRVAAALRPGGLFVFDLIVADPHRPLATRAWRAGDDWAVLAETREDAPHGRLTRDIVVFRRAGAAWQRSDERHRVRAPPRAALVEALRRAGFAVRTARRYGTFALAPRRLAFVARRSRSAHPPPDATSAPGREGDRGRARGTRGRVTGLGRTRPRAGARPPRGSGSRRLPTRPTR
jgi:SAM-dependent methyltransferase